MLPTNNPDDEEERSNETVNVQAYSISRTETLCANTRRDRIATEIWVSYEA